MIIGKVFYGEYTDKDNVKKYTTDIIINEFDETDTYIKSLNPEIWRG